MEHPAAAACLVFTVKRLQEMQSLQWARNTVLLLKKTNIFNSFFFLDGARSSSSSFNELLDKEFQATGSTPPTSRESIQINRTQLSSGDEIGLGLQLLLTDVFVNARRRFVRPHCKLIHHLLFFCVSKLIVLSQVVDFILVYWQKRTSEVEKCRFFSPTHWLQLLKCERSLLFCIVVIWIYLCLLADLDQLKSVKILRRSPGTWHGQKRTNTQAIERKKNQEINMENDRQMPP